MKLVHIIGVILIGAGLIGVWISDMRSRQCWELPQFSEAVRNIAVSYDGLVVPGALVLLVSSKRLAPKASPPSRISSIYRSSS